MPGSGTKPAAGTRRPRVARPVLALLLVVATASRGRAQPAPPETPEAQARALFDRGVVALQEGEYASALALFEESYGIQPRGVTLYNVGMCRHQLHDVVGARRALAQYVAEAGPDAPPELLAGARDVLAQLDASIGSVLVTVSEEGATVLLDSMEVGVSPLDAPLETTVGEHVLQARKEGFEEARVAFAVGDVEPATVDLVLAATTPPPPAPPPEPVPGGTEAVAPPGPAGGEPSSFPEGTVAEETADNAGGAADGWFWTTVGLAAAAGATAVATGTIALVYSSDYEAAGVPNPGLRDDIVTYGLVTDVLIGATVAAAGAALLLYFLRDDAGAGAEASPEDVAAIGPGSVVIRW